MAILICLLDILVMFRKKEPYYLLNQLYIEEYCVWVQHISDTCTTLPSITVALEKVLLCKPSYYLLFIVLFIDGLRSLCILSCAASHSLTYCIFFQKVCGSYAREQVGFDLVELEAAAAACEDEEMEEDISSIVRNVRLS